MNVSERDSDVNYEPSRKEPKAATAKARAVQTPLSGHVQQIGVKEQNFKQAGELYRSYTANIMLSYFYKADADYGTRMTKAVNGNIAMVKAKAAQLKD